MLGKKLAKPYKLKVFQQVTNFMNFLHKFKKFYVIICCFEINLKLNANFEL